MEWERQRAYDFESGKEAGIAIGKEAGIAIGKETGISLGAEQKAVEDAVMLVHDYNASPEVAAQKMKAPLELVLEALEK